MTAEAGFTRFTVRHFGNPLNSFYEVRPDRGINSMQLTALRAAADAGR
jgi:hypothetical protein